MSSIYPRIGDVIADKYRIERKLGGDGMGTVFCATHLMTGRRFALKWMNTKAAYDNAARERFIREFQATGSIDHPNVVAMFDVGSRDGALYIVMEYLEGESLAARIARGPMAPSECVPIIVEAMRGVAAAHQLDIVHRDLKPDNIFICESSGRSARGVKVLDFGVMKAMNARANRLPSITAHGLAIGTPPYMAPEQVLAQPSMDHRIDIYAFGVILYEALSGRPPFGDLTGMRLLERIVRGGLPPLSQVSLGVPVGLEATVMRALSRDPRRRFAQLADFAACLQPWAAGVTEFAAPVRAPGRDSVEPAVPLPGGVFTALRRITRPIAPTLHRAPAPAAGASDPGVAAERELPISGATPSDVAGDGHAPDANTSVDFERRDGDIDDAVSGEPAEGDATSGHPEAGAVASVVSSTPDLSAALAPSEAVSHPLRPRVATALTTLPLAPHLQSPVPARAAEVLPQDLVTQPMRPRGDAPIRAKFQQLKPATREPPALSMSKLALPPLAAESEWNIWSVPTEIVVRPPRPPVLRSRAAFNLFMVATGVICSVAWTQWMFAYDGETESAEETQSPELDDFAEPAGTGVDPAAAQESANGSPSEATPEAQFAAAPGVGRQGAPRAADDPRADAPSIGTHAAPSAGDGPRATALATGSEAASRVSGSPHAGAPTIGSELAPNAADGARETAPTTGSQAASRISGSPYSGAPTVGSHAAPSAADGARATAPTTGSQAASRVSYSPHSGAPTIGSELAPNAADGARATTPTTGSQAASRISGSPHADALTVESHVALSAAEGARETAPTTGSQAALGSAAAPHVNAPTAGRPIPSTADVPRTDVPTTPAPTSPALAPETTHTSAPDTARESAIRRPSATAPRTTPAEHGARAPSAAPAAISGDDKRVSAPRKTSGVSLTDF